jgi:hypothetical protein
MRAGHIRSFSPDGVPAQRLPRRPLHRPPRRPFPRGAAENVAQQALDAEPRVPEAGRSRDDLIDHLIQCGSAVHVSFGFSTAKACSISARVHSVNGIAIWPDAIGP